MYKNIGGSLKWKTTRDYFIMRSMTARVNFFYILVESLQNAELFSSLCDITLDESLLVTKSKK
jgi:hypothetical protein